MSIDYPNRAEWLAKRSNRVAGWKIYGRWFFRNGTYSAGRTAEKVRIWNAKRHERAMKRLLKKAIGAKWSIGGGIDRVSA